MPTVSGLFIYPIKSLSGIALDSALVTSRGLQHDRRLMLVDEDNCFLTQRAWPQMALLQPEITADGLYVYHKQYPGSRLFVPFHPGNVQKQTVQVWDDLCESLAYDHTINQWFSEALGMQCRLVYMPESSERKVDTRYAHNNEITSFADGYPMLLISQDSLDDLNARLDLPVPMNRFRPNIVFKGDEAFLEDRLGEFRINDIVFKAVKPCARCQVPTINQDDLSTSKEPLKTLAIYRFKNNKILFGQNLLHRGSGLIRVGDAIDVQSYQAAVI